MKTDELQPTINIKQKQGEWIVDIKKDDKQLRVKIFDRGELPEFEIVEYLD